MAIMQQQAVIVTRVAASVQECWPLLTWWLRREWWQCCPAGVNVYSQLLHSAEDDVAQIYIELLMYPFIWILTIDDCQHSLAISCFVTTFGCSRSAILRLYAAWQMTGGVWHFVSFPAQSLSFGLVSGSSSGAEHWLNIVVLQLAGWTAVQHVNFKLLLFMVHVLATSNHADCCVLFSCWLLLSWTWMFHGRQSSTQQCTLSFDDHVSYCPCAWIKLSVQTGWCCS